MIENNKRLPAIGEYLRGSGTLVAIQDARPEPPPPKDYIFEEITAEITLRLGDHTLKECGSLWDAYGKEASVTEAIRAALLLCETYGVTRTGELEIVVVKIVEQVRKRIKNGDNFYAREYADFEPLSGGGRRWDLAETKREVVWSSRLNLEEGTKPANAP